VTGFAFGAATHEGRVRPSNQDAMHAGDGLFIVADGMGGHRAGEIASELTVDELAGHVYESVEELAEAVRQANALVVARSRSDAALQGMGTTVCALALVGGPTARALLANVGDSRAYRCRAGAIEQLTVDHSYVADLVRRGALSSEQAEIHPYRNMLTRAIGIGDELDVDTWELEVEPADRFLLCTDGLFNELTDDEIAAVLARQTDPGEAAGELITNANERGGRDNVTVVVVDVTDTDAEPAAADGEPVVEDSVPEPPATQAFDVGALLEAEAQAAGPPGPAGDAGGGPAPSPIARSVDVSAETRPLATITAELPAVAPDADEEPEVFRYEAPARRARRGRRIPTGLAVAISAFIVAVLLVALTIAGLWARSGTHLGFVGDELVVMEGRDGGFLWFDETVSARTGVRRAELTVEQAQQLDGRSVADVAEAVAVAERALRDGPTSE